jgi:hypothetical protein
MRRHFASGDSNGPNDNNLQRNFWHLALDNFRDLIQKWERYSVGEDDDKLENEGNYTEDDFVVDAAVVLILAGTSVTQLIGQNVTPDGDRVPQPRQAYEQLLGHPPPDDFGKFIAVYDALRHFGSPKYDAVEAITPEHLCQHLRTAQSAWWDVLRHRGEPIGDHLQNYFTFPE